MAKSVRFVGVVADERQHADSGTYVERPSVVRGHKGKLQVVAKGEHWLRRLGRSRRKCAPN